MSEREFEAYLNLLARTLKLSEAQRQRIAGELRDHLEERMADLIDEGMDRDAAILAALDEFGDANVLAHDLSEPRKQLRRRRLMQTSFATLATAAVIATGFFYFLPTETRTGQPMLPTTHAQATHEAADTINIADADTRDIDPLEQSISLDYDAQPLESVLNHLQSVFGLNIFVYWDNLGDVGIEPSTPVSMQLTDIRAKTALDLLTSSLGDGEIAYQIRDNVLVIGSRDQFESAELTVRMYRCGELLENAEAIMGGRAGHDMMAGQLMDLIRESLGDEAWSRGESYAVFAGMVVVRQTPARHRVLEGVLDQLGQVLDKEAARAEELSQDQRSHRVRTLVTQAVELEERQAKVQARLRNAAEGGEGSEEVRSLKIELRMIQADQEQIESELNRLSQTYQDDAGTSKPATSRRSGYGESSGFGRSSYGDAGYGGDYGGAEYGGGYGQGNSQNAEYWTGRNRR